MKKRSITVLIAIVLFLVACEQKTTANNPVPAGETRDIGDGMSLTILDVISPANSILNESSEPGSEYAIIKLRIQCNRPTDMTCNFGPNDMKFADESGLLLDSEAVSTYSIDELELITEISGGETMEGNAVLLVSKGDMPAMLVVYQTLYGSPYYFAIP